MIKIDIKQARDPKDFMEPDMFTHILEISDELFSDRNEFRLRKKAKEIQQTICHRDLHTNNLRAELKKIKSKLSSCAPVQHRKAKSDFSGLTSSQKKSITSKRLCEKILCEGCKRFVRRGYMSQHKTKSIHFRNLNKSDKGTCK